MWFENGTEMHYGVFWNPEKGGLYYGDCQDQDTIHAHVRATYLENPPDFDSEDPGLEREWVDKKESLDDKDFADMCVDLAIELNEAIRDYGDF